MSGMGHSPTRNSLCPMWTSVLLDIKSGMVFSFNSLFDLKSCTANKSSNFCETFPLHECFQQRFFFPNINTVSTSFNKKNLKCLQNFKFCLIFIEAFSCLKVWSRTGSRKLTNIWDRAFSKKAIIAKGFILDAGGVLDTP